MQNIYSKIFRLIFLFFLLIFICDDANAQKEKIDVIYLKNGSVIRGEIVEIMSDGRIKVESLCDNIWVFATDEIERMVKEEYEYKSKTSKDASLPINYNVKGLYSNISASLLQGREEEGVAIPYVGFLFLTGYQWENGLSIGGGLGLEIFDQSYMPFVVDVRYLMNKKKRIAHFIFLQGGYSYSLDQSDEYYEEYEPSWGYLVNPGLGVRINLNSRNALNISVGFRYQVNELLYEDFNNTQVTRTKQYSRVIFTFSYCFK